MSKAFINASNAPEDDESEEAGSAPSLPVGVKNYMTVAGHAALRAEFEQLVKVERPSMVQVVSWAAGNGDRSENGDYIYGKKRLREIDRRIRFLGKRLESAVVVDPAAQENREQVFFAATVVVCDGAGVDATYKIVGIDEARPDKGLISWISPLARALLKAREGDLIRFASPGGVRELDIVEIRYE